MRRLDGAGEWTTDVTENLALLVVFAPAYPSRAAPAPTL